MKLNITFFLWISILRWPFFFKYWQFHLKIAPSDDPLTTIINYKQDIDHGPNNERNKPVQHHLFRAVQKQYHVNSCGLYDMYLRSQKAKEKSHWLLIFQDITYAKNCNLHGQPWPVDERHLQICAPGILSLYRLWIRSLGTLFSWTTCSFPDWLAPGNRILYCHCLFQWTL